MRFKLSFASLCWLIFLLSQPSVAFANVTFFPPENAGNCDGSAGGAATGRSVLTWSGGNNDVSCRDLPSNSPAIKTDGNGNLKTATSADVTSLVTSACPAGQVLGGINNGVPTCVTNVTPLVTVSCPAGQMMVGVSNGAPVCVAANSVCASLGGVWTGTACTMPAAFTQNTCMWVAVPCDNNGCNGTKTATCPVGYYVAGHGNYREGDWTRTGYNQFYCCK